MLWIHGSTVQRLEQDFRKAANKLLIPGYKDTKVDILKQVSDLLSEDTNGCWLMVLDNADDSNVFFGVQSDYTLAGSTCPAPIIVYLPRSSNGFILVTTQDERVGRRIANGKPIKYLTNDPTRDRATFRR